MLEPEERREDGAGQDRHVGREDRAYEVEALSRAQDGDRRRDDAVAVEQRGPDQDQDDAGPEPPMPPLAAGLRLVAGVYERQEGEYPALSVVVGRHDVPEVLHAHHQDERPEDEREHAENPLGAPPGWHVRDAFAHGVEGARAYVAEDDAERSYAEGPLVQGTQACLCLLGHAWSALLQADGRGQAVFLGNTGDRGHRRDCQAAGAPSVSGTGRAARISQATQGKPPVQGPSHAGTRKDPRGARPGHRQRRSPCLVGVRPLVARASAGGPPRPMGEHGRLFPAGDLRPRQPGPDPPVLDPAKPLVAWVTQRRRLFAQRAVNGKEHRLRRVRLRQKMLDPWPGRPRDAPVGAQPAGGDDPHLGVYVHERLDHRRPLHDGHHHVSDHERDVGLALGVLDYRVRAGGVQPAIFTDASVYAYNATPFTTVSGLTNLNGETVQMVGDGMYLGTAVVSAGSVTLPTGGAFPASYNTAVVGLAYTSILTPMPIEPGVAQDSGIGKTFTITRVVIQFLNTLYAEIVESSAGVAEIQDYTIGQTTFPTLTTKTERISMPSGFGYGSSITVQSANPLPLMVTAIIPEVAGYE